MTDKLNEARKVFASVSMPKTYANPKWDRSQYERLEANHQTINNVVQGDDAMEHISSVIRDINTAFHYYTQDSQDAAGKRAYKERMANVHGFLADVLASGIEYGKDYHNKRLPPEEMQEVEKMGIDNAITSTMHAFANHLLPSVSGIDPKATHHMRLEQTEPRQTNHAFIRSHIDRLLPRIQMESKVLGSELLGDTRDAVAGVGEHVMNFVRRKHAELEAHKSWINNNRYEVGKRRGLNYDPGAGKTWARRVMDNLNDVYATATGDFDYVHRTDNVAKTPYKPSVAEPKTAAWKPNAKAHEIYDSEHPAGSSDAIRDQYMQAAQNGDHEAVISASNAWREASKDYQPPYTSVKAAPLAPAPADQGKERSRSLPRIVINGGPTARVAIPPEKNEVEVNFDQIKAALKHASAVQRGPVSHSAEPLPTPTVPFMDRSMSQRASHVFTEPNKGDTSGFGGFAQTLSRKANLVPTGVHGADYHPIADVYTRDEYVPRENHDDLDKMNPNLEYPRDLSNLSDRERANLKASSVKAQSRVTHIDGEPTLSHRIRQQVSKSVEVSKAALQSISSIRNHPLASMDTVKSLGQGAVNLGGSIYDAAASAIHKGASSITDGATAVGQYISWFPHTDEGQALIKTFDKGVKSVSDVWNYYEHPIHAQIARREVMNDQGQPYTSPRQYITDLVKKQSAHLRAHPRFTSDTAQKHFDDMDAVVRQLHQAGPEGEQPHMTGPALDKIEQTQRNLLHHAAGRNDVSESLQESLLEETIDTVNYLKPFRDAGMTDLHSRKDISNSKWPSVSKEAKNVRRFMSSVDSGHPDYAKFRNAPALGAVGDLVGMIHDHAKANHPSQAHEVALNGLSKLFGHLVVYHLHNGDNRVSTGLLSPDEMLKRVNALDTPSNIENRLKIIKTKIPSQTPRPGRNDHHFDLEDNHTAIVTHMPDQPVGPHPFPHSAWIGDSFKSIGDIQTIAERTAKLFNNTGTHTEEGLASRQLGAQINGWARTLPTTKNALKNVAGGAIRGTVKVAGGALQGVAKGVARTAVAATAAVSDAVIDSTAGMITDRPRWISADRYARLDNTYNRLGLDGLDPVEKWRAGAKAKEAVTYAQKHKTPVPERVVDLHNKLEQEKAEKEAGRLLKRGKITF